MSNTTDMRRRLLQLCDGLRANPSDAEAYRERAQLWLKVGQYGRALADFGAAVRADAKDEVSWNGLATIWAKCPEAEWRDGRRAIVPARRAYKLDGGASAVMSRGSVSNMLIYLGSQHVETLAAAYAEAGKFDEAVRVLSEVALVNEGVRLREINAIIKQMKAKKPMRDPPVSAKLRSLGERLAALVAPAAGPQEAKPAGARHTSTHRPKVDRITIVRIVRKLGGDVGFQGRHPNQRIVTVNLMNSPVTDKQMRDLIERLSQVETLEDLALGGARQLTDAGLKGLSRLKGLTSLSLARNSTDGCLKELAGLTNLRVLHMGLAKVTGDSLGDLRSLRKLGDLGLSSTVADDALKHLSQFTKLERVLLNDCKNITDAGLVHLKGMKRLRSLELSGCDAITDAGIRHLTTLKELRRLEVQRCPRITDVSIKSLKALAKLESVSLEGTKITQQGRDELRAALPRASLA
jgi:tetratricopeptide (TPR) repeat protein